MSTTLPPRVSVVIRSYNRIPALCELLAAILGQRHDSFEIVVVDQSRAVPPEAAARFAELCADPRVRLLRHPPLGGPRARNVGVQAARGELILLMDDDDLPADDQWIAALVRNFDDPLCLAVTGRQQVQGEPPPSERALERARRDVLSFVPVLMWQRVMARADRRKRVASVLGGNVAIRRSAIERFGLWDECTPIEDELSFCFRLHAGKRPDEYLLFDPEAVMIRRLDIPGGMNKRTMSPERFTSKLFTYFHNIVGHYYPVRFVALYPAYYVLAYVIACDYEYGHLAGARRTLRLGLLFLELPFLWTGWLAGWTWRRVRDGAPPRAPSLTPRPGAADAQPPVLAGSAGVRLRSPHM